MIKSTEPKTHRVSVEVLHPAGQVGCLAHHHAHIPIDLEETGPAGLEAHLVIHHHHYNHQHYHHHHLAEGIGGEHGKVMRLILPVPGLGVRLWIA